MRIPKILTVLTLSTAALFAATTVHALTIDEIIELCNSGYTTADILEFAETLGLDEPLDSEALVRLREEGCDRELALELAAMYGTEEGEEYDREYYDYDYGPSWSRYGTHVSLHAGWGYPSYSYGYWGNQWYSPWWGVGYSCFDPWYWDSWYWDSYCFYPRHRWGYGHNYYGWNHHRYDRRGDYQYRYRYVTAHEKAKKSRARLAYRANASRTAVAKSYQTRANSRLRTTAYKKDGATAYSKSTYRIKDRSENRSTSQAIRKTTRSSSSTGKTYRRDDTGKAKTRSSARTRRLSGAVKKSPGSSSSHYRSTKGSGSYRSTKGSSPTKSTVKTRKSGSSSKSSGSGGGYSRSSSSSSSKSSSSSGGGKSSSSSRSRRR